MVDHIRDMLRENESPLGDQTPVESAPLMDSADQLVALMTQNMASFGATAGHNENGGRD